jgi:hypothetical protein
MRYWDTSALAKLYLPETDRASFQALALGPIVTAHLTRHELRTVFRRREAEGTIQPGAAAQLYQDFESDIAGGILLIEAETTPVQLEFIEVLEKCFSCVPPVFIIHPHQRCAPLSHCQSIRSARIRQC